MFKTFKRKLKIFFIGKPLNNEAIHREKFTVIWGLPILASDAISSVAYAGQEMLLVLLPLVGGIAFGKLTFLSGAIICLLAILVFSYRQTIHSYPNGGGSYIVSMDNLGKWPGLIAGAALAVDYILTVAVSISSGVEQIASAFSFLKPFSVPISVLLIVILMVGNLRGIRESSKIFGIPTYAFIFALGSMIVVGFYKLLILKVHPSPAEFANQTFQPLTLFLLLRAFSSGCTALTGVEAVSNAVPNFKPPSSKNANKVLLLLGFIILFLFGGTSILARSFQVIPGKRSMLVLMAEQIFGGDTFMYFFLTVTAFLILIFAANTAFADFPMLISIVSRDGFAPRQLSLRGDKLAYDNGIIVLTVVSSLLVIIFRAEVTLLINLYAVGVFISFTLSQSGMFVRWKRLKGKHWHVKAFINGFGAIVTFITCVIIAFFKFKEGAYIVILLIPILVFLMNKTKKHYDSVKTQLHIEDKDYSIFNTNNATYNNHVIVPIESVNKTSMRALRYALTIDEKSKITAFTVAIDKETAEHVQEKYKQFNIDIPLKVVHSPYRKIVDPLLDFIKSEEFGLKKGEIVTVILPKFMVNKKWHNIMHNHTTRHIENELLKHRHIVVSIMPYQLQSDK